MRVFPRSRSARKRAVVPASQREGEGGGEGGEGGEAHARADGDPGSRALLSLSRSLLPFQCG